MPRCLMHAPQMIAHPRHRVEPVAQSGGALELRIGRSRRHRALDRVHRRTILAAKEGEDGAVVMNKVMDNKDANHGYDARLDRYCDMVKEGIIDPTKVVRSALQNAASVATLLLTSDALVADMPKEEKKPAGGGGYDDMY
jgi:chaperonin GroEL (HSP60 family)